MTLALAMVALLFAVFWWLTTMRVVDIEYELARLKFSIREHRELQARISDWLRTRFGAAVAESRHERAARVLEEAAELAQAEGVDLVFAGRVLARVYARPRGEPSQEAAGVAVTLLAWASVTGVSLDWITLREVERVEGLPIEHFRRKHAEKAAAGTALAGVPPGASA